MTELEGKRLLIVDDEPLFLQTTTQLLQKEGADCKMAGDAGSAIEQLERHAFDLILTDLNMPGNLRWELLQAGRKRWSHVPMIVITGVPSLPSAIESLRLGVTDYLLKPVAFPELLASIQRTLMAASRASLVPSTEPDEDSTIVGNSPAISEIIAMIDRIAASSANVLISGETGTGKELIARSIHERSPNGFGNFQVLDCNTIVDDQLALDLFGSVDPQRGKRAGLLEHADEGTLFLDEVAELPLTIQPKLLRVVQNQQFTPIGSSTTQRVNVRFISSTQKNMNDETAAGRFRSDLYYRLGVLSINLPPLRSRGHDVILLAEHFLKSTGHSHLLLSSSAKQALMDYRWPGNVRELRNVILRAATFVNGSAIEASDLPAEITSPVPLPASALSAASIAVDLGGENSLQDKRLELERGYLLKLLTDSRGNVTHAAQKANMSRQGFHKLLRRHQISAADYR